MDRPVEDVSEEEGVGDEEDDVAGEVEEEVALDAAPLEVEVGLHDGVEEHLARRRALEVQHVLQHADLVLAAAAVLWAKGSCELFMLSINLAQKEAYC